MLFNSPEFIYFFLPFAIAKTRSRALLIIGLVYNFGLLGYFKHADFFLENWNLATGSAYPMLQLVLPLGLSFFTFQVIAFLVDCYKGYVGDFNLGRFAFSMAFFPHLIAGPILHYSDVMPQLRERMVFDARQFSQGLFLFAAGLCKKSVIADRIAEHVDPLFAADTVLPFFEAWVAAIGYGLQIYFDFSGYSDMAIGIGLLFGIILPQNFNSPYQAVSIADFWKRWHRTLSRFLRDYVYIPLGGNRNGFAMGLLAAAITMVIGGLWHGAAWTFVLWGMLHGLFIGRRLAEPVAMTVTFLAVSEAWVLFRAASVDQALSIWQGMLGLNGMALPASPRGFVSPALRHP
jgi:alginate O-acetyltransferase complex protein AlgI